MNISNVVLDRDKEVVTFDDDHSVDIQRDVLWAGVATGWIVNEEVEASWDERINNKFLSLAQKNGLSLENLSVLVATQEPVKQERYLKADGTDTIDKWAATRSHEVFREIMYAQVEKYHDRLGEKDPILEEVTKMADYMNRWVEYEKQWDKEDAE